MSEWRPNRLGGSAQPEILSDESLRNLGAELRAPTEQYGGAPLAFEEQAQRAIRYCSFCWSEMPDGATACADCGASVADMQEAQQRAAEADSAWVPPHLQEEPDLAHSNRAARHAKARQSRAGITSDVPAPTRPPWQPLVLAVVLGGVLGTLAGSVAWLIVNYLPAHR